MADAEVAGPVPSDAGRRRDRIKLLLSSLTTTTEKVADLLATTEAKEDHLALGYASWPAYLAGEYRAALAGLSTAARPPAVVALADAGLSSRAIAEIAGVDQSTVVRDRKVMQSPSPEAAPASPPDRPRPIWEFRSVIEGSVEDAPARRITGVDGKSYPAPAATPPKPARRRPLPDAYLSAVYELEKVVERLERLHKDDRFPGNRKALQDRTRARIARNCTTLHELLDGLGGEAR